MVILVFHSHMSDVVILITNVYSITEVSFQLVLDISHAVGLFLHIFQRKRMHMTDVTLVHSHIFYLLFLYRVSLPI
jgi:hypothetical protein